MHEILSNELSHEEINNALKEIIKGSQSVNDWFVDPIICMAGPLYQRLFFLSCASSYLAKKHIEKSQCQSDVNIFLDVFYSHGPRYVGKVLLATAFEIDEIENLTKKDEFDFIQNVFEKIIYAVNEKLFPERYPSWPLL